MPHSTIFCLMVVVLACTGATARPIRLLQQQPGTVGYVPVGRGCELQVTVTAGKSDTRWWGSGPAISGNVQILNPKEYGIPVSNVQVTAQSSTGQVYTGYANCGNGSPSTFVPVNPQPYTYGEADCSYKIQLDNRVFGAAAQGSSSNSVGSGQPGRLGYFPDNNNNNNNQQPTWTVTAIVTTGMTNAQCYSTPVTVDTSSWWSWFANIIGSSSNAGSIGSAAPGLGSAAPSAGRR